MNADMNADMNEYRVVWTKLPRRNHDGRVLFVKARSSEAAKSVAEDYIERKFGITNFAVDSSKLAEKVPEGKVTSEGQG